MSYDDSGWLTIEWTCPGSGPSSEESFDAICAAKAYFAERGLTLDHAIDENEKSIIENGHSSDLWSEAERVALGAIGWEFEQAALCGYSAVEKEK